MPLSINNPATSASNCPHPLNSSVHSLSQIANAPNASQSPGNFNLSGRSTAVRGGGYRHSDVGLASFPAALVLGPNGEGPVAFGAVERSLRKEYSIYNKVQNIVSSQRRFTGPPLRSGRLHDPIKPEVEVYSAQTPILPTTTSPLPAINKAPLEVLFSIAEFTLNAHREIVDFLYLGNGLQTPSTDFVMADMGRIWVPLLNFLLISREFKEEFYQVFLAVNTFAFTSVGAFGQFSRFLSKGNLATDPLPIISTHLSNISKFDWLTRINFEFTALNEDAWMLSTGVKRQEWLTMLTYFSGQVTKSSRTLIHVAGFPSGEMKDAFLTTLMTMFCSDEDHITKGGGFLHCEKKIRASPWVLRLTIHAALLNNQTSDVYGLNWPLIPRDSELKTILGNQSQNFVAACEWTLYVPKYDNEIKLLAAMGNAFASKERGEKFEHCKQNGRFGPVKLRKFSPFAQQQEGYPLKYSLLKNMHSGLRTMSSTVLEKSSLSTLIHRLMLLWLLPLKRRQQPMMTLPLLQRMETMLQIESNQQLKSLRALHGTPQYSKLTELFILARSSPGLYVHIQRTGCTKVLDDRQIPSGPEYKVALADVNIHLDIKESTTTVKARFNALNLVSHDWLQAQPSRNCQRKQQNDKEIGEEILARIAEGNVDGEDADDRDDVDPSSLHIDSPFMKCNFEAQRALLMCHSLPFQQFYDFTEGTTDAQRNSLFGGSTTKERLVVDKYLCQVPGGILIIRGAAGVGKTSYSILVLHLHLLRKKRILTMAATNQAVNNITERLFAQVGQENEFLLFRFWTERLELDIVLSTEPSNLATVAAKFAQKHAKKNIGYAFEHSLANAILKLAGLIPTTNKKILELKEKHQELSKILNKPFKTRLEDERKTLKRLVVDAMKALIATADMIFTTTTLAASKPMRKFVASIDITCVDEAASATELEILIGWKGGPLILAADMEQLLPPVFSEDQKDENGVMINSFVSTLEVPLIRHLRDADWPYVDLNEQKRMAPGLFGPANHCIYTNVTMAAGVTINDERFELARKAEAWSQTLSRNGIYAKGENESLRLPASPTGKHRDSPLCALIHSPPQEVHQHAKQEYAIIVPYLGQRAVYLRTILAAGEEFEGITVATANSFMGWENAFVFVAAGNLGGKKENPTAEDPSEEELNKLQAEAHKKYKLETLRSLWAYFHDTKRMVFEDANHIIQPIMVEQVTQGQTSTIEVQIEADREKLRVRRHDGDEEDQAGLSLGGSDNSTWGTGVATTKEASVENSDKGGQETSSGTADIKAASPENVNKDGQDKSEPNSGSGAGGFIDDFDITLVVTRTLVCRIGR
ncbi:hypothetical protein L207DRAFT_590222 [Hyaloscypha variabilis F]|uniref:DNA2/NAM7 helicase helicase domain-containing protein n=1 Tax=Hyaloscypha variabilis (strain UAMH 11265 / GT02V1 / F) TaxID=1149755 RepID=A0A2J6R3R2_HYAVF|nr:hypothetical protein L207DRAFT_590222 [Hyaloscypha variabilis F]